MIAHDRAGITYYAQIAFNRYNDTNGVFVQRSTNGGFTWSRACVPINGPSNDATTSRRAAPSAIRASPATAP